MTDAPDEQPTDSRRDTQSDGVSLLWLAAVLLRRRRFIAIVTGVGIVLSLAIALLRPTTYTTTFTFLPQAQQDQNRAGLASLAGQFGLNLGSLGGTEQSPQLYADLLVTRGVLSPIATGSFHVDHDESSQMPLSAFLKVRGDDSAVVIDETLQSLREDVISTSVASRTTGVVTVRVRTKSRYVSLGIADRLLIGLNNFNLITRQSQAREERRFTEARLAEAQVELRTAEDKLQRFLENNRQFNSSAALQFQQDRLQRDVQLQQQVVASLAQQYEENRIREVRDTPVITVIDTPILAARPDARFRALIILLGAVAAFGLTSMVVMVRETWIRDDASSPDPAQTLLVREWNTLRRKRLS
ncbi:MAG: GNVR domain-containing protein [Gemmatimonadales bacterium]|nr:GNVR domain-containing protein [Gemmatimonadales bacterium]MDZ4390392.1 GNVR domain-containing protein [Gemmatimonadales bacterium]